MKPFQERVVIEKAELDAKLAALAEFLTGKVLPDGQTFEALPDDEKKRLSRQYDAMAQYCDALEERIAAFQP